MLSTVLVPQTMVPISVPWFVELYKSAGEEYAELFPYPLRVRPFEVLEFHVTVTLVTVPPEVVVMIPELLLLLLNCIDSLPPALCPAQTASELLVFPLQEEYDVPVTPVSALFRTSVTSDFVCPQTVTCRAIIVSSINAAVIRIVNFFFMICFV